MPSPDNFKKPVTIQSFGAHRYSEGRDTSREESLRDAYEAVVNGDHADTFDEALGWDLFSWGEGLSRKPEEGFDDRAHHSFLGMDSVRDDLWDNRYSAEEGKGEVKPFGVLNALYKYDYDRREEFVPKLEDHVITHCAGYAASVAAQIYPKNPDLNRGVVSLAFPKVSSDVHSKRDSASVEFPRMDVMGQFVDSKNAPLINYKPFNVLEFPLGEDGLPDRTEMELKVAELYAEYPGWAERMTPILDAYFMASKWPSLSYKEDTFDKFDEIGVGKGGDPSLRMDEMAMLQLLFPRLEGFQGNYVAEVRVRKIIHLLRELDLSEKGSRKNFVVVYKIKQILVRLQEALRDCYGSDENNIDELLRQLLTPREGEVHLEDVEMPFHEADSPSVQRSVRDTRDSLEKHI